MKIHNGSAGLFERGLSKIVVGGWGFIEGCFFEGGGGGCNWRFYGMCSKYHLGFAKPIETLYFQQSMNKFIIVF